RKPSLSLPAASLSLGPSTAYARFHFWRFSPASESKLKLLLRSSQLDSIDRIVTVFFGCSPLIVNGASSSAPDSITTRPLSTERDRAVVDACAENCVVIANRRSDGMPRCGRYAWSSVSGAALYFTPSLPSS